jgi:predicted nucleotide-binding protein (sugar kinase/HSP70/actin superfamily)
MPGAELKYSKDGRLLFTKEMKKKYKILLPMMLPVHFTFFQRIFNSLGYDTELLTTNHAGIVNEGLQDVHNDTCYPALLVIGQMVDAIKSGKYDNDNVALMITQTGGGCRASNYIHLLRKALKKNNLEHIPVISLNISGMEKNSGFKVSLNLLLKLVVAIMYGDALMLLSNQARPYEVNKGETDELVQKWEDKLDMHTLKVRHMKKYLKAIVEDFDKLDIVKTDKIKVGIVGEIYIKYSPLGNNNLEDFLASEDCEVIVPGLLDFLIFICDHKIDDYKVLGVDRMKSVIFRFLTNRFISMQDALINAVASSKKFRAPARFKNIKKLIKGYVSSSNKMGEGWLLTAEMLELIESGVKNIVCTQPFGCLPNHVVGKGMIRKIRENHPEANIVAIDYDPGATKINQENRLKLMLSIAKYNKSK